MQGNDAYAWPAQTFSSPPIGGGGMITISAETPSQPLLDEVRSSLESAVKDVKEIAASLLKYGDATLGNDETKISQAATQANRPPDTPVRAVAVRNRLRDLHSTISTLRRAANRIHAI